MNTQKMAALEATPRTITDNLKKIRSKPFFFLFKAAKQWEKDLTSNPVLNAAVVQANTCLYDANESSWAPAVMLYTTDQIKSKDKAWLQSIVEKVLTLKTSGTGNKKVDMIGAYLVAEESSFDVQIPVEFTDGVPVRIFDTYIDPENLPGRAIPESGILPAMEVCNELCIIPPALYN